MKRERVSGLPSSIHSPSPTSLPALARLRTLTFACASSRPSSPVAGSFPHLAPSPSPPLHHAQPSCGVNVLGLRFEETQAVLSGSRWHTSPRGSALAHCYHMNTKILSVCLAAVNGFAHRGNGSSRRSRTSSCGGRAPSCSSSDGRAGKRLLQDDVRDARGESSQGSQLVVRHQRFTAPPSRCRDPGRSRKAAP